MKKLETVKIKCITCGKKFDYQLIGKGGRRPDFCLKCKAISIKEGHRKRAEIYKSSNKGFRMHVSSKTHEATMHSI